MRSLARLALVLALAGVPFRAQAIRVDLGTSVIWGYDSNVFGGQEGQGDWSAQIAPRIAVQDEDGAVRWRLRYEPEGEYFVRFRDASTWDQLLFGNGSWRITPRTTISVFDSFARLESANNFNTQQDVASGEVVSELDFRRQRRDRNLVSASLVHRLSDVSTLSLSGRQFYTDFADETRADNDGYAITGGFQKLLSPRTSTGLVVSWTHQQVKGLEGAASRSSDFVNASLSVRHAFSPRWTVAVSAGPTWVNSDDPEVSLADSSQALLFPVRGFGAEGVRLLDFQSCPALDDGSGQRFVSDDCQPNSRPLDPREVRLFRSTVHTVPFEPGMVSNSNNQDLTYFANASIVRTFERGEAELFYRRQATENSATNQGSSSVADILGVRITLRPWHRWRVDGFANYTVRAAATDQLRPALVVEEGVASILSLQGGGFVQEFVPGVATSVAVRTVGFGSDLNTVSLNVRLRIAYQLFERTDVFFRAGYSQVENQLDGTTIRSFNRYTAGIGVNYRFDPIFL